MLLLYHSHKHISYPIRTIARSAINRNEKAFVDEDKESIELAEAIFEENNMFHFRKPGPAMDYILHKLINDRKLFEEMKDRGTSIIRLFSLLSMYHGRLNCCVIRKGGCITEHTRQVKEKCK